LGCPPAPGRGDRREFDTKGETDNGFRLIGGIRGPKGAHRKKRRKGGDEGELPVAVDWRSPQRNPRTGRPRGVVEGREGESRAAPHGSKTPLLEKALPTRLACLQRFCEEKVAGGVRGGRRVEEESVNGDASRGFHFTNDPIPRHERAVPPHMLCASVREEVRRNPEKISSWQNKGNVSGMEQAVRIDRLPDESAAKESEGGGGFNSSARFRQTGGRILR